MKPVCPIDEYASIRFILFCHIAPKFPTIMLNIAITAITVVKLKRELSIPDKLRGSNGARTLIKSPNPAIFGAVDKKAVTGVGAPSYTSGAQK